MYVHLQFTPSIVRLRIRGLLALDLLRSIVFADIQLHVYLTPPPETFGPLQGAWTDGNLDI